MKIKRFYQLNKTRKNENIHSLQRILTVKPFNQLFGCRRALIFTTIASLKTIFYFILFIKPARHCGVLALLRVALGAFRLVDPQKVFYLLIKIEFLKLF